MKKILEEIRNERIRQDAKWGGPDHDDEHDLIEFSAFIMDQLVKCHFGADPWSRQRFVKIAALAVAALEMYDRTIET